MSEHVRDVHPGEGGVAAAPDEHTSAPGTGTTITGQLPLRMPEPVA